MGLNGLTYKCIRPSVHSYIKTDFQFSSGREGKFPLSCELSNTKETFLSVPVLRKVFLSGNQPLISTFVTQQPNRMRENEKNRDKNRPCKRTFKVPY